MTKSAFKKFWAKNYPETQPINYVFRQVYKNRWLRIHSLPDAKRYADTEEEYTEILARQNQIISDLLPIDTKLSIIINFIDSHNPLFQTYSFLNLGTYIDKAAETVYQSFLINGRWQSNAFDDILVQIADDKIRAFIVSNSFLISPYDGGMDIIFPNEALKYSFKTKYQAWLSKRVDGL